MTIDYSKVDRLQREDKELLIAKNTAYGNSNLTTAGLAGVATRLLDKISRLHTLIKNSNIHVGDESVRDTLGDISNYGILGRMLMDGDLNDRPTSVYLVGPIDMADPELRTEWRTLASTVLGHYGISVFNPYHIAHNTPEAKRQIMELGYAVCNITDTLLAYLPHDVPSLGAIREIEYARYHGKKVVVASPWAGKSAFSGDLDCFATVPEALVHILKISNGEYNELISAIWTPTQITKDKLMAAFDEDTWEGGETDGKRADDSSPGYYYIGEKRVPIHQDQPAPATRPDRMLSNIRSRDIRSDRV